MARSTLAKMRAVVSSSAVARLDAAEAWLRDRKPSDEVVVVAASLEAANDVIRKAVASKGAAFGWHRLTLPHLAHLIAARQLSAKGLVPVSTLGLEAITTRLVHQLRTEGRLGRFAAIAEAPGLARAFARTIQDLRMARVDLAELASAAPELLPIIESYEAELVGGGLIDWPGVLEMATSALQQFGTSAYRLAGLPLLLLDVVVPTRAEQDLVGALAQLAPEILITAVASDAVTLRGVRDRLGIQPVDLDESASDRGNIGAVRRLQSRLFSDSGHQEQAPEDEHEHVRFLSAPGEGRECVEIARRILGHAKTGGGFDRVAVLLRSPETYRAHISEAFARAGIPAHFARGTVRPDPAGRAFLALLRCAADGLSAKRFAEYLSLGQVPNPLPSGSPPAPWPRADSWIPPDSDGRLGPFQAPDTSVGSIAATVDPTESPQEDPASEATGTLRAPRRWERLLVEAAVIGGKDRWARRIGGLKNELAQRLLKLRDEDDAAAESVALTARDLDALSDFALPLIGDLDQLPQTASWGGWLDKLSDLATRSLKEPERVLGVLSEICPMAPVGPITLGEVLQTLEKLLLEIAEPPSSQRYGKVFVGPIDAARGLSFDVVFVPGLAEKMFPRKISEDPILLDATRRVISPDLTTNAERLEAERLSLSIAAGAARTQIWLSYPRIDLEQARARVPSFYGLEAVRAAEGRLPDFTEFAKRSETSTNSRLGWPAPSDPAEAIDDAEHDLAILAGLVGRSGESAGGARYLLSANTYLARALRARYQRWGQNWTSADGMLSQSKDLKSILARHALDRRSYSPTALQHYAYCPYRFFLQAIHRLAPREVPEAIDEMDPLQRGLLIHDVQFEILSLLKNRKALPVTAANLDRARKLLDDVLDEAAARYKDDLAPAIERVWDDGISAIRADLREWLRRGSEDDSGYVPSNFELSFGLGDHQDTRSADPNSVPGAIDLDCGIQLRGSIDLVERHPSGSVRVTDHKSGRAPQKHIDVIAGGKTLQPLLYALAAEKILPKKAKVEEGRLYFFTSRGDFKVETVYLNDRARAAASDIADIIGDAIAAPFLPAAPDKSACESCDYRIVCGPYEARRTSRKPQANLDRLNSLRETP